MRSPSVSVHPAVAAAVILLAVVAILLFLTVSGDSLSTGLVYEAY